MEGILIFKKGSALKLKRNINIKTFEDGKNKLLRFAKVYNIQKILLRVTVH